MTTIEAVGRAVVGARLLGGPGTDVAGPGGAEEGASEGAREGASEGPGDATEGRDDGAIEGTAEEGAKEGGSVGGKTAAIRMQKTGDWRSHV